MLVGIRRSLGSLSSSGAARLDDWQYKKVLVVESDWMSSKHKPNSKYKFFDYAPLAFQKIRRLQGINEREYVTQLGPEQIMNNLVTNVDNGLYRQGSSGRSGGIFYYTKDRSFMVKTISKREFFILRDLLKDYINHL